jgi:superfamily I DNA/RNA helicase
VLAGAGTGKTRVLTTRIAHILNLGLAWPSQILAVTFTNKAAREMKERIGVLVGEAVEGMPWLGTFHSIGVKILRRHPELAGLRSDFTILDTDDQIRLVKQVIQAEGIDDKRWAPRTFAQMIDGWKNKGFGPKDIPEGDARLCQRQGPRTVRRLPGPAENAERGRFRRPALPSDPHLPRSPGRARRVSPQVQICPRRRVPGHQHRPIHVAPPDRAAPEIQATPALPNLRGP